MQPKKAEEKPKLANQGQLEAARSDQPQLPQASSLCDYNELHTDGTIAACKLPKGHMGNHDLLVTTGSQTGNITWSITFHVGPQL